jgi:hypothetical protein
VILPEIGLGDGALSWQTSIHIADDEHPVRRSQARDLDNTLPMRVQID